MAFVRPRARICERSITSGGSGPFALGGAMDNSYNTFSAFMAIGDKTYASVVEPGAAFWSGIVTYSAANQVTLTTIEETHGTFGAGTKEIFAGALASTSMFREDISGAIVTGGTSTAYTVASNRKYVSTADLDGNIIAFTVAATNADGVTLNVDGLGAFPLVTAGSIPVLAGSLVNGTIYTATFINALSAWKLHGFFGNPFNIPLGGGMDYWGSTVPNSNFAFPIGQQISQTTYAALYAIFGPNRYGADGGGLFFLPNKTGRVSAMKEASASLLTTGGGGVDGGTLGAKGGAQNVTLGLTQIPGLTTNGSNAIIVDVPGANNVPYANGPILQVPVPSSGTLQSPYTTGLAWAGTNIFSRTQNIQTTVAGTGAAGDATGPAAAHSSVQPTIVCNYIMRII